MGLGETNKGLQYLHEVEMLDINHQGIQALRSLVLKKESKSD
jgi:hypothetical protein